MGATPKPGANPVAPVQEGKTIQEFERELAGGDARLACNGGGDVCLEILRRRQAEMQRRFEAGDFSDFEFVMGVPVVGGGPRSLLSRFHATQTARHFNFAKVKQFAEAMLRGKWDWARDPKIIVDKLGNVVSGHHRILAAERAGVQIPESAIHRLPSVTPRPVQPWPTVPP
jgi:DNA-binding GntR family transcriptional regulator